MTDPRIEHRLSTLEVLVRLMEREPSKLPVIVAEAEKARGQVLHSTSKGRW